MTLSLFLLTKLIINSKYTISQIIFRSETTIFLENLTQWKTNNEFQIYKTWILGSNLSNWIKAELISIF
jgi:hypothetical protein